MDDLEPGASENVFTVDLDSDVAHASLLGVDGFPDPIARWRRVFIGEGRVRDVHDLAEFELVEKCEHALVLGHGCQALLLVCADILRLRRLLRRLLSKRTHT